MDSEEEGEDVIAAEDPPPQEQPFHYTRKNTSSPLSPKSSFLTVPLSNPGPIPLLRKAIIEAIEPILSSHIAVIEETHNSHLLITPLSNKFIPAILNRLKHSSIPSPILVNPITMSAQPIFPDSNSQPPTTIDSEIQTDPISCSQNLITETKESPTDLLTPNFPDPQTPLTPSLSPTTLEPRSSSNQATQTPQRRRRRSRRRTPAPTPASNPETHPQPKNHPSPRPSLVVQCFNCLQLHHTAATCTHSTRCNRCGGPHRHTDCKVPRKEPKCANCEGQHAASFPGYPFIKRAIREMAEAFRPWLLPTKHDVFSLVLRPSECARRALSRSPDLANVRGSGGAWKDDVGLSGEGRVQEGFPGKLVEPSSDQAKVSKKLSFWVKKRQRNICSKSFVERKLPIIKWLPTYTINYLIHDIIAGFTVGLTAIPQGIANAVVGGLDPQYGLYSGFMGSFTYIIFGSCKDITIGPTAILAIMTQKAVEASGTADFADFAVLLCFLSGCIILLLGLLNLGFLVDFISVPVTAGFTSAAALTIASAQVKGLLGIKGKSNDFLESWISVFEHIDETREWDVTLGVCTIVCLLLMKKLNDFQVKGSNLTTRQIIFNKALWLTSLGRNAIAVVIGGGMAYGFYMNSQTPFLLTGDIEEGIPPFKLPPFSTVYENRTYEFLDMTEELGTTLITLPLISVLESFAIAKSFSKGKSIDATQEMIALGLCNIAGSFVSSMPITGSFTRTAVNNASGVKTQLGGLVTGTLVLLSLGLLTSSFYFIPKATLAGIIIAAMFSMVDYELVPLFWKTRKLDLFFMIVAFFSCLLWSLEYGFLIGIAVNMLYILYDAARPKVNIRELKILSYDILLVTPDQNLMFPAAEYVRKQVIKKCISTNSTATVVVDGRHIHVLDITVAKAMEHLSFDLKARKQNVILWNWRKSCREVCLNLEPKMKELFHEEDNLEQLCIGVLSRRDSQDVKNNDIPSIEISAVP
ncbi:sodium-independent sulfate anion transporter [Anabrus simplex]|uniref:sodium-independent sulfate anion transporter n=1 Tax=Anabrus simplex TaxID=316456 RepID=UPI0035A34D92